jgi:hypothetical protein
MSRPDPAPRRAALLLSGRWAVIAVVFAVAGIAAFLAAIHAGETVRAWQAYLVNFVFWSGLAFGAVLFSALLNITNARWGRPVKRLGEAFAAYLPFSFVLFLVLYFGREELFHWVRQPVPEKQAWLNLPFMFGRDGAGLLLLTVLSIALVRASLKGDRLWMAGEEGPSAMDKERWAETWRAQRMLSPALAIAYAFVLSLLGFDLVMSLDPHWYSTLFGGYYFIGSFYSALAALYLLSLIFARTTGLKEHLHLRQLHDLGKLVMAFCIFTGYLFYTQFLVIWYGNLPEETRYVILRVKLSPWEPLAWAILFMIFLIPFFLFLSRKIKVKRIPMILLSVMILAGMWLERFILVAPSLWKRGTIPIGLLEVLISAGFLGLVALCLICFLRKVPIVPVSDPLFRQLVEEKEERLEP